MKTNARRYLLRSVSGFTLIEMIGVLAIIAILAVIVVPKVFSTIAGSRVTGSPIPPPPGICKIKRLPLGIT